MTNTGPRALLFIIHWTTVLLCIEVSMPIAVTINNGPTSRTTRYSVKRREKLRGFDTYQV